MKHLTLKVPLNKKRENIMGIGGSIFLIAVGAILTWAVDYQISGFELSTAGIILMAAGGLLLILSLIMLNKSRRVSSRTVVDDGVHAPRVNATETRTEV